MFDNGSRQRELEVLRVEIDRLRNFVETHAKAQEKQVDGLRNFVESRAQTQENLVRAMLREAGAQAGEALEARIEFAAREAIAFAEQGLQQQQAALRGLGQRVAELSKQPAEPARTPWVGPAAPPFSAYLIGRAAPEWEDCRRLDIREGSPFLADLAELPIPPGGAAKLVASHVLQYAPTRTLQDSILPHWRERLAPGGELLIVTLDGPAWTQQLARDAADFERMRARIGAQGVRPVRSLFDFESLRGLLQTAGLAIAERPNATDRLELRVLARAAP